jgi:putative transposase
VTKTVIILDHGVEELGTREVAYASGDEEEARVADLREALSEELVDAGGWVWEVVLAQPLIPCEGGCSPMVRRRHTPEQVVRKLREAHWLLAEGKDVEEGRASSPGSEQTYHRWRAQYGGMKVDDVRWLRELEVENTQLKRTVADRELEVLALKEIAKGNW